MSNPVGGSPNTPEHSKSPGQKPAPGGKVSNVAHRALAEIELSELPSLSSRNVQPGGTKPSGEGVEGFLNSRKGEVLQAWKQSLPFRGLFSEADNLISILSNIDLDKPFTVELKDPNILGSISSLPDVFQNCEEFWCAGYSNLKTLPPLPKCTKLWCFRCDSLKTLPDLPNCTKLCLFNCPSLQALPELPVCTHLDLHYCPSLQLPHNLTACIELNINDCKKLETLPKLPNCIKLKCTDCRRLRELPRELPACTVLNCTWCDDLEKLSALPVCSSLYCHDCPSLQALPALPVCRSLYCHGCPSLQALPDLTECTELHCTKCYNLKTVQALPKLQKIEFETYHLDEATRNRLQNIKTVVAARNRLQNIIEKRSEVKEGFRSAYECEVLEESFKFTQIMSYEKITELNQEQFPVLQRSINGMNIELGKPGSDVCNFFEELGIFVNTSDKTLHFPKKETLEQKLVSFRQKHPDFPPLSIAQVTEIVQPDAFLKILLENDFIYSDPPELIHDICFHLIPMLKRIFLNPSQYEPFRKEVVKTFTELGATLDKAKTDFEDFISPINEILNQRGLTPITKEDWTLMQGILEYTMSGCLDILATASTEFVHKGGVRKHLFQLQKSLIDVSPVRFDDFPWPAIWAKELSLSQENLGKVLTIIISGRHEDFLNALYGTTHVQ